MKIREKLYAFLQFTWALPQTLLGLALYTKYRKCPHRRYKGAVFTDWKRPGGISLGPFIFAEQPPEDAQLSKDLIRHEYGHSLQSMMLGPLYLPFIGLPSLIWANLPWFRNYRMRKHRGYYQMFAEKWASRLGKSRLL